MLFRSISASIFFFILFSSCPKILSRLNNIFFVNSFSTALHKCRKNATKCKNSVFINYSLTPDSEIIKQSFVAFAVFKDFLIFVLNYKSLLCHFCVRRLFHKKIFPFVRIIVFTVGVKSSVFEKLFAFLFRLPCTAVLSNRLDRKSVV